MSPNRCDVCGNLNRYCTCRGDDSKRPPPDPTPWVRTWSAALGMINDRSQGRDQAMPTLTDLVMVALGFTHPDDSLWLCRRGCGVTSDDECDYGGWHGDDGSDSVLLRVVEDDSDVWS